MRAADIDIHGYFQPVLGTRPWRAKLGVGSFLTFEFGRVIRAHGHKHGEWRLWIYLSKWVLFHRDRELANSDTDRRVIAASIRRLEQAPLTDVRISPQDLETAFVFGDFRLVVSAADYLGAADERDHYWLFFMPDDEVLAVGPSGVGLERSGVSHDA